MFMSSPVAPGLTVTMGEAHRPMKELRTVFMAGSFWRLKMSEGCGESDGHVAIAIL